MLMEKHKLSHYFNSQPHEEADRTKTLGLNKECHFNSQPHEEADDASAKELEGYVSFQLTASRGG